MYIFFPILAASTISCSAFLLHSPTILTFCKAKEMVNIAGLLLSCLPFPFLHGK